MSLIGGDGPGGSKAPSLQELGVDWEILNDNHLRVWLREGFENDVDVHVFEGAERRDADLLSSGEETQLVVFEGWGVEILVDNRHRFWALVQDDALHFKSLPN